MPDRKRILVYLESSECITVASLGGGGGQPRVTPSRGGDTRTKKIVAEFTKNSGQRRSDK